VIENSAGGTKVDFFQERRISYQVDLWDEGAAEGSTELELTNDAPTSGQPVYVIGPDPGFAKVGEDVQLVTMYCVACRLEEAHRDGRRIAVSTGTEGGLTYYRDYFGTPSGTTRRLDMTWYIPDAWEGDAGGGRYRLVVFAQSTIRPTRLDVAITVPDGMHIESASPGMRIDGETAVFEGVAPNRLELEVRFAPSVLGRLWGAITP